MTTKQGVREDWWNDESDPWRYGWRYVPGRKAAGVEGLIQTPITQQDLLHPQEGDFICHSTLHTDTSSYLWFAFEVLLRSRPGTHVLRKMRVDWGIERLQPHCVDIAVFADVSRWNPHRETFSVKEQGGKPLLVVEVTAPTNPEHDLVIKVEHYWLAGVPEYAIVDQAEIYYGRQPRLLGYRWTPTGYAPVNPDSSGMLHLESLHAWLAVEKKTVRCYDARKVPIPDALEAIQHLAAAKSG